MHGAKSIRNHIFLEKYSGEKATIQACKVLCLAACVLADRDRMIVIEHPDDYIDSKIPLKEYSKLSYVRKLKLEAYGYIVEGVRILEILDALSKAEEDVENGRVAAVSDTFKDLSERLGQ